MGPLLTVEPFLKASLLLGTDVRCSKALKGKPLKVRRQQRWWIKRCLIALTQIRRIFGTFWGPYTFTFAAEVPFGPLSMLCIQQWLVLNADIERLIWLWLSKVKKLHLGFADPASTVTQPENNVSGVVEDGLSCERGVLIKNPSCAVLLCFMGVLSFVLLPQYLVSLLLTVEQGNAFTYFIWLVSGRCASCACKNFSVMILWNKKISQRMGRHQNKIF